MQWNEVMQNQIQPFSADQAREYCQAHSTQEYQLIDVRQPGEYEAGHIPGSTLLPLDQIISGQIGDLDKSKPTLVYCHAGRRSAAAAQWMNQNGFGKVIDIQGGWAVWSGLSAQGPVTHNLNLISAAADFPDALTISYAMEDGLQVFYQKLSDQVENPVHKDLLGRLASFEDNHKANLAQKGAQSSDQYTGIMEGGFTVDQMVAQVLPRLNSLEEVFSLAMAIEAQAFDFYSRLSAQAENTESKTLFSEMADEEKTHLGLLAKEMDQMLSAR